MRAVRLHAPTRAVLSIGLTLALVPAAQALPRPGYSAAASRLIEVADVVPRPHPLRAAKAELAAKLAANAAARENATARESAAVRENAAARAATEAAPREPAAASAPQEARAPRMVGGVPVPLPRPGRAAVVARLSGGKAVPVATTAFAPAAPAPADALKAAEGAATGKVPPAPAAGSAVASIASDTPAAAPTFQSGRWSPAPLKRALDALKADRYPRVLSLRSDLADPLDRAIVDYFLVRSGSRAVPASLVAEFARDNPGFPTPNRVRAALEAALSREGTAPRAAAQALGGRAQTAVGTRLLVRAEVAAGEEAAAKTRLRRLWHGEPMGAGLQKAMAQEFGALLTVEDHLARVDMLVGRGRLAEARSLRSRLGSGPSAYVGALIAAAEGASDASARLKSVPDALARRPGARLAAAEILRRSDRFEEAAKILLDIPAGQPNGDAYWTEARIVGRSLAERGEHRSAYALASRGFATSRGDKADEAFHAGWFALEGLGDAKAADRHFAEISEVARYPISLARAAYWRGRAAGAANDAAARERHFRDASRYGFTYYGQLAREALRLSGTGVPRGPQVSASDRAAMAKNALAEAVRRLVETGHEHRIWPFIDRLSETVPTAGQLDLVTRLARDAGPAHFALMAAKEGQRRGLEVGRLAYPTTEIPRGATVPVGLDRALVYAIARQESLFNTGAVSPAGARGLMQVMPRTASSLARELKLRHSQRRLTSDPAYNATLGAAYLAKRLGDFDGSYILTFAAYNAGAGRVREWIERFGDPRSGDVDAVTWVEQIPYPETRNYVMRVLENVQVYREALGTGRLAILEDLARGRPS